MIFHLNTDDDCEKRLQRLREVAANVKNVDFSKYASSSRSCEADDEFDDEEEKSGENRETPDAQQIEEEDEGQQEEGNQD